MYIPPTRQDKESGTSVACDYDYGDDDEIKYIVPCYRSDDDNPPPLLTESLDDDVWKLERYLFNDGNNNFNYDDIDKEIL